MARRYEKRLAIAAIVFLGGACLGGPHAAAEPEGAELKPAPGKADKLPVPLNTEARQDYPVAAGGKEDRAPVPPQTTKRKVVPKTNGGLPADDRLTPDPPDPDRLIPEQP